MAERGGAFSCYFCEDAQYDDETGDCIFSYFCYPDEDEQEYLDGLRDE